MKLDEVDNESLLLYLLQTQDSCSRIMQWDKEKHPESASVTQYEAGLFVSFHSTAMHAFWIQCMTELLYKCTIPQVVYHTRSLVHVTPPQQTTHLLTAVLSPHLGFEGGCAGNSFRLGWALWSLLFQ